MGDRKGVKFNPFGGPISGTATPSAQPTNIKEIFSVSNF